MRPGSRGLRWSCHLTTLLWLAALLVTARADGAPSPVEPREPQVLARLRPLPEPAAAPAPEERAPPPAAPPPKPPSPAPAPAPPAPVAAGDVARGDPLLAGGAFPVLTCRYDAFPSFLAYARAMAALGARFVVVRQRQIVGGIDLARGVFHDADLDGRYSPRARDYTGEPGLASLARRARERFGPGAVVMMLVPRAVDAGLFGGIARVLAERGLPHDGFREIEARYEASAGGVRLRVDAGIRPDGSRVPLDFVFDLGALARQPGTRA